MFGFSDSSKRNLRACSSVLRKASGVAIPYRTKSEAESEILSSGIDADFECAFFMATRSTIKASGRPNCASVRVWVGLWGGPIALRREGPGREAT